MQDFLNSTRRSISAIKKAHDQGRLIMKPPFQRNPVWTDAQKSYLIDTILRGYPIPEIYLQENVDENGEEIYIIVDGQQRLRACLEFIEGKFSLSAKEVPDWADLTFDELLGPDKKQIYGYNFIVRQLPNAADEQLRVIFKRLNRNVVALNRQELRHATYWGPFITSMEALSDLDYWSIAGIFTANDIRRMLDIEYVSEIAVAYLHGLPNKKSTLDKWYETYEKEYQEQAKVNSCFNSVLGELSKIIPNIVHTRWRKKSDFYSLFLCLAKHEADLPMSKTGRALAQKKLEKFGQDVNASLAKPNTGGMLVRKYVKAVEKAASDLGSRQKRADVLEALLNSVWSA